MDKKVIIYTDGACSGNPGKGGWAAILSFSDVEKVISGGDKETTNNRMELTAAIMGLKALRYPCDVVLYSDSEYITNSFNKGWIYNWIKKDWVRGKNSLVKNVDL